MDHDSPQERDVHLATFTVFFYQNAHLLHYAYPCAPHCVQVRSHGVAVAAFFLLQQMGCIGFNVSVHTAAAAAMVPQVNRFQPHSVRQWQQQILFLATAAAAECE